MIEHMDNKRLVPAIILLSFFLAVGLGMLDRETQSLAHLFTAEWGNVVALILYTGIFATIGLIMLGTLWHFLERFV